MKTLLFTLEYPPFRGGIADYNENLVRFWPLRQAQGEPKNEILVLNNNDGKLINNRLPVLKWLPAVIALWRTVKKKRVEHILVAQILPLGYAAFLVSRFFKINYSVFLHGMDLGLAQSRPRKRFFSRIILDSATAIICNSSFVAKMAEDFLGKNNKIKVVHPGIESHITHPPASPSEAWRAGNIKHITRLKEKYKLNNKLVLLTVGRLVKRKGMDKVLEALPEILKIVPNLIYVIVGNGEELDNIKLQVINYKLQDSVLIITDASDDERDAWYDLCDIFIMAARRIAGDVEGFGIVYLEAGLAGKPVIAGDSGGVRDAVVDGETGLLVDPENSDAIADAIIHLAQNEPLRRQLGERGRERAIKYFNWEEQVRKIYDIIAN